jgi:hypothetical protein
MFIDNELNLDEKIDFVKKVHSEEQFYSESIDLLEQEKLLRSDVVAAAPHVSVEERPKRFSFQFFTPFLRVAEFGAVAVLILFFVFSIMPENKRQNERFVLKRFVIYQPEARNVQIAGSFTNWDNVPMKMDGTSGYWEIELDVLKGEHRYVFIIGDDQKIADPTILARERDDFGSENSVLVVEA